MVSRIDVFHPFGPSVTLNVSATTASIARTPQVNAFDTADLRIANIGATVARIALGGSDVAATVAAGMPILPGTAEVFQVDLTETHVAAITEAGSTTLVLTTGRGA
jgi:hypothetical protein